MFDYIVDHALKNVWCTPDQDKQLIIKPKRLTPNEGVVISFDLLWNKINVPDLRELIDPNDPSLGYETLTEMSRWHIYQIGQVHPLILGLLPNGNNWTRFDYICNKQSMVCDIYTDNGVSIPKVTTYYKYNNDKDIIIATKINKLLSYDYNRDSIYLRFYTNAFFEPTPFGSITEKIYVEGAFINTMAKLQKIQNNLTSYRTKYVNGPGVVTAYKNGIVVETINAANTKLGDTCEFVYDSSIYKTVEYRLGDLRTFYSTLDSKRKYLLHYDSASENNIDYLDDIDVFIYDKIGNKFNGLYYHRNSVDAVRMVTHRDYAIVPYYLADYIPLLRFYNNNKTVFSGDNLVVKMHIRRGGHNRPLVFETNRIHELYKLSSTDIKAAMLSEGASINNFKAEVLESSDYTKIMRSSITEVTNEIVQSAYGYNGLSKLLGDTPTKTRAYSNRKEIDVPYGLTTNCTAYEYDANGYLLGYYTHTSGSVYLCNNNTAASVEMLSGISTTLLDEIYGTDNLVLPVNNNYRVYKCNLTGTGIDNNWIDITDTANYIVTNNTLRWAGDVGQYLMIRSDSKFLAFDIDVPISDGDFSFSIVQTNPNTGSLVPMNVPNGDIDIFLNNKLLIKGLDFYVKFPDVVITNKEYLINPLTQTQKVHVRFTGFCDKNLQLTVINDVGFINQGTLSKNNKFDLRDDRVQHITINGGLVHKEDLLFSEADSTVRTLNAANGLPYQIKDIVVPLKGLTQDNTYVLRNQSIEIDKVTSAFLTLKLPQATLTAPSAIIKRYNVVSPFICKIIYDLVNDIIKDSDVNMNYDDNYVLTLCNPYSKLLTFDQSREENSIDTDYVDVHPHNLLTVIELSIFKYRFIEKVVRLYSNKLITLSPFISIKQF